MRSKLMTAGSVACALLALTVAVPAARAGEPGPARGQAPDPGRAIFHGKGNCSTCHGPEGRGTPLAPDLTDAEWVNFEGRPTGTQLEALVKAGVAKPVRHPAPMPPMGGARLSAEEISQVSAYVLSIAPPEEGGTEGVGATARR